MILRNQKRVAMVCKNGEWSVKCAIKGNGFGSLRYYHLADVFDIYNGKKLAPIWPGQIFFAVERNFNL